MMRCQANVCGTLIILLGIDEEDDDDLFFDELDLLRFSLSFELVPLDGVRLVKVVVDELLLLRCCSMVGRLVRLGKGLPVGAGLPILPDRGGRFAATERGLSKLVMLLLLWLLISLASFIIGLRTTIRLWLAPRDDSLADFCLDIVLLFFEVSTFKLLLLDLLSSGVSEREDLREGVADRDRRGVEERLGWDCEILFPRRSDIDPGLELGGPNPLLFRSLTRLRSLTNQAI